MQGWNCVHQKKKCPRNAYTLRGNLVHACWGSGCKVCYFFLKIYENVWHLRLGFCLLKWTVSEPFLVKLHALFTTVPIKAFSVRYELELHVLVFEIFSFWFVVIRKSKWRAHFLLIRKIGEIIKIKPFFESEKGRYLSIFYQTKASRVNTVAYQT